MVPRPIQGKIPVGPAFSVMQEFPNENIVPEKEATKKIAVFDVCDTLYYSNTTHDFIRYVYGVSPNRGWSLFRLLNGRYSPVRPMLVAFGVAAGKDIFRKANIGLLRGLGEDELLRKARDFVREYLSQKKIDQIHRLVKELKEQGHEIVLCSSSIEPVVKAVAEDLGISEFYSAELECRDGRFTGRLSHDPTGRKLESLAKHYADAKIEFAVSDNFSDAGLLKAASKGIAVVHRADKRRFWKDLDLELIDLTL